MSLDLERPQLLLLLPACFALVVLLWRSSRAYMPPFRRRLALGLRLAVIGTLTLALAGPLVQLPARELAVAVLLDRSDSVTPAMRAEQERWLGEALAHKEAQDQLAVVSFGGQAVVERALSPDPKPPRLAPSSNMASTRTNIAAAIRAGLAVLPASSARRLVLLSDGQENQERAEVAAALAAAAGVQILSVPLEAARGPEVLARQLDAPAQLREGERFTVGAQIQSTVVTPATLHVLIDGRLALTQDVMLQPGTSRFVLPLEPLQTGHHVLRLQVEADEDTLLENNSAGAYVVVQGPPRVLVIEGAAREGQFLTDALRATGLLVDVGTPGSAGLDTDSLRNYAGVVLVNVPAEALAPGRMQGLKTYVRDQGGGLVVVGGERAFGPGGYARSPLEEMLPVRMDLRGKSLSASVALMIVMDVSGSMGGGPGGATKMDLAKEAALAAVELLGEYDQVGVLAFDDQNHWMIRPTFASDLDPIEEAISRMQPGGGTEIYPALKEGYEALLPIEAKIKHVILLTDGQSPRGPYEELARRMDDAHITVSTVGIGSDADTQLLQEVASLGHGRYYDGNDPFDLPQLLVKETQQVQRAAIVEEEFTPLAIAASPATEGIDFRQAPPLRGYVATTAKPQTSILLTSRQLDPILSEWQYGLGRVIAWTSDANNRWSSRWVGWPEFGRFWAQVVKRTTRPPEDPNRQVAVKIDGDQARITLDAQTGASASERHYLNFLPTQVRVVDPRGSEREFQLPQVAPGRYEAQVPVEDDGVYTLTAVQTETSGAQVIQSAGFVVPYSPEYLATGVNETLLARLAGRTGGRLISSPEQAFLHDLPAVGAPRALWPMLLILTALLFVADIAVRRLRFSALDLRSAVLALRRRLGYIDDPLGAGAGGAARPATSAQVSLATSRLVGHDTRPRADLPMSSASTARSGRLLAAKQRASRR